MKNQIAYSLTVNFTDNNWDAKSQILHFSSKENAEAYVEKLNANTQFKKDVISWIDDLFSRSASDVYPEMLPGTIAISLNMLMGKSYGLYKLPEEDERDEHGKRLTFKAVHGSQYNLHSRKGYGGVYVEEPVKFGSDAWQYGHYTSGSQRGTLVPISGRYKEYYEGKITIPYPELNEKFHSVKSAVISEIELQ